MRRSALRWVLLSTALAVAITAGYQPLTASAEPAPPLDATATEQAISTQQLYRAPGAVAEVDEPRVRAELTPATRVILAPFVDFDHRDAYRETIAALQSWARTRELRLIVVTGLSVRLESPPSLTGGHFTPSGLSGLQAQLAYADVTDLVVLAARNVRDGTHHLDDPQPARVPADSAEVAATVAALRADPRYVAPGAGSDLPASALPASLTPGLPVRVALLPALALNSPFPELAPTLSQAFPGELVVVVRGRWIEAAGPRQDEVDSARSYLLGRADKALEQWGTPPYQLVTLFLKRLAQLRDGAAFHRPMVRPVLAAELFDRYAQRVFITLAVLLGGGSLLLWAYRLRRRRLSSASALRVERARTYADLASVGAELVATDPAESRGRAGTTFLGQAAERHATARTLLDQADTPGGVRAAQTAATEARRLLARAAGADG